MFNKIKEIELLPNFIIKAEFISGVQKLYDMKPLFAKYEAFQPLRDIPGLFAKGKVDCGGYGIAWTDDIDIDSGEIWYKFVEHLQYISIVWARNDLSNEEKFNLCSQHWDGKETIELLAQRVLERLCVLVIHINDFEYLLDSIYLFSDAYTRFLHKLEQSERNSKAGKASYKKYESLKQKTFEYAQDLLNKSKTKYTANALADKITNAYLLGNIPEIKFNAENPKPTIYKWLKNEFPYFTNNEKKI